MVVYQFVGLGLGLGLALAAGDSIYAVDILAVGFHHRHVFLDEDVVLIPWWLDHRYFLILQSQVLEIRYEFVVLPRDVVATLEWPDRYGILLPAVYLQLLVAKWKEFFSIGLGGLWPTMGGLAGRWFYPKLEHLKLLIAEIWSWQSSEVFMDCYFLEIALGREFYVRVVCWLRRDDWIEAEGADFFVFFDLAEDFLGIKVVLDVYLLSLVLQP